MDLRNETAHPHLPALVYDHRGREVFVVIMKASVRLSNGSPHPAPLPVHPSDLLFPSGAVQYPADLVPWKLGTDIVCNGHVYAPAGKACTTCDAELRVGDLRRELKATGPRRLPDADPEPFEKVLLGAEHAPGLAALGARAEERRRYLGTFDENWQRTRAPLLPEDMDERFWNAAQLISPQPLVGGESVLLVNLSTSGRIETALPRVPMRVRVDDRDVRPRLDLVVLEPDEDRIALTFRVAVDVTGSLDRRTPKLRIVEKRCAPLGRKATP